MYFKPVFLSISGYIKANIYTLRYDVYQIVSEATT